MNEIFERFIRETVVKLRRLNLLETWIAKVSPIISDANRTTLLTTAAVSFLSRPE